MRNDGQRGVSAEKYIKPLQVGPGQIVAATVLRGPGHQHRKHDRNENECRYISQQMMLCGIVDGLNA
jgi:hypothetical protein